MELENSSTPFEPIDDRRPKIVEPPPVKIGAVADVTLPVLTGLEHLLDAFYMGIFKFEREEDPIPIYRAENFRIYFRIREVREPRMEFRPLVVIVPSLAGTRDALNAAGFSFTYQRGLSPGEENVILLDPAGNFVQVMEERPLF